MRILWTRYGKPLVGVPEDGVERVAEEVVGADMGDFFDVAVRGTADLNFDDLLEMVGVRFCLRPQENSTDKGGKASKTAGRYAVAWVPVRSRAVVVPNWPMIQRRRSGGRRTGRR